ADYDFTSWNGSRPRPLPLVVVSQAPVQSTEQLQQASLLPAGDELLQRLGDRRLFCLLPAHGERTVEELGVDGQIGRHVWTSTHQSTHRWQEGELRRPGAVLAGPSPEAAPVQAPILDR